MKFITPAQLSAQLFIAAVPKGKSQARLQRKLDLSFENVSMLSSGPKGRVLKKKKKTVPK